MPEIANLLQISLHVIKPMPCEWEGCTVILNCGYNLKKHVLRHCDRVSNLGGEFHCHFLRCAGRVHGTKDALRAHVDLSHLSRLALSCPILDCEKEFSRASQLKSHFEINHKDLVGRHVTWAYDRLVPTALLARRVVPPPPPLPSQRELLHFAAPKISLPPRPTSSSSLVPAEPTLRKWRRLEAPDEEEGEEDRVIPLADLVYRGERSQPRDVTLYVRRRQPPKPLNVDQRLSAPQSIPQPVPSNDHVPHTIGFSVLTQKFGELFDGGA